MHKLTTVTAAALLALGLSACSKADDAATPAPASPAPSSTSSAPTTSAATPTESSTPSDSASTPAAGGSSPATSSGPTSSSGSAPAVAIDQGTPEAAMTSWLNSMVAGDGTAVCNLMASGGKAISEIEGAGESCGKTITPLLQQVKGLGSVLSNLDIKGATVKGNDATFEAATTEPAAAAQVIASFKAVKIGGKWYVTR
ncbi:hypothetical protein [Terracoccus luteus]|uniref:Lipoprotein n=1 Tax=Terracoccus luteus TaxID=53356 RepID=A0A839PQL3_9MICO|nr:hypothetical protein [Terracoccus luteus]MBB2985787.1 hypothetical protein [Terracoccus luteus]MCP2171439.1 hypothetical protein [Terracoccus luteus]